MEAVNKFECNHQKKKTQVTIEVTRSIGLMMCRPCLNRFKDLIKKTYGVTVE